jgi:glutamate-5-semialdehyde dehydrogenase
LGGLIDVTIPRGGRSLIERVSREATMPVIKHFDGICHVYVDKSADLDMARSIVLNSKCQRPGVCNALETLLVHQDVADEFLPNVGKALVDQTVELRGCERSVPLMPGAKPASEQDYRTEYLDLILSVRTVNSIDEAIDHITKYGSAHTESIITEDTAAADYFTARVDSAAVMVNASTRFNDGAEFGLGAEIGISTDRFHARGPCGLREITTYKYVVHGDGQIRV